MTVYLDVILIENLCMNYIILFATGYIMKLKIKHLRIILSSAIGGVYAIISYMDIIPVYSTLIAKVILSINFASLYLVGSLSNTPSTPFLAIKIASALISIALRVAVVSVVK